MKRMIVFSLFLLLMLAGCNHQGSYEPVDINPDIDVCEICNMSITEVGYATEAILKNGAVEKFDDIGCMVEFLNEQTEEPAAIYVKDTLSGEWIPSKEALYVFNEKYWTPMMYGVVSFKDKDSMNQYMEENGQGAELTFEQVVDHFTSQGGAQD